jgi:Glycosyltransferase family 10 (fucosyltransferase) C-term/Alpha-(1,3)-fucosyltransferase FucT N-terminal domain
MLKVRFLDTSMPEPFESHVFVEILRQHFNPNVEVVRNNSELVDIEFVSNKTVSTDAAKIYMRMKAKIDSRAMSDYRNQMKLGFRPKYKTRSYKRVWFTGENLRAPLEIFDLTLSFDKTDVLAKNIFFPFWFYRCNWYGKNQKFDLEGKIETLLSTRIPIKRGKTVVTFTSNFESSRARIVRAIEHIVRVDCFGQYFGNSVKSKAITSANYGLQICNENDLYPNYVTEKLQEAWISRNIPIWAGLDTSQYFNKEAVIDVTNFSMAEISERIATVTEDEIMYRQSLPLLIKVPKLDDAIEAFGNLMN